MAALPGYLRYFLHKGHGGCKLTRVHRHSKMTPARQPTSHLFRPPSSLLLLCCRHRAATAHAEQVRPRTTLLLPPAPRGQQRLLPKSFLKSAVPPGTVWTRPTKREAPAAGLSASLPASSSDGKPGTGVCAHKSPRTFPHSSLTAAAPARSRAAHVEKLSEHAGGHHGRPPQSQALPRETEAGSQSCSSSRAAALGR